MPNPMEPPPSNLRPIVTVQMTTCMCILV